MSSSLHNHTYYSVQDGFGSPKEMLDRAKEIGLKAFAVTEHGNAYSWVYFDKLKNEYPEIKIIYGVELYECFDTSIKDKNNKYFHLIVLAKNEQGRKSLNEIITRSEFEGKYFKPRVDLDMLKSHANNLIILSACLASKIAKEKDFQACTQYIEEYKSIFPNFYLEMQSHKHVDQEIYNKKILKLSQDTNTPFVITTDSHASIKEHLKYQARHVQIARDEDTASEIYEGCYMQSDDEIHEIMDSQIGANNVNIGLKNSDRIAELIDVVNMPFQSPQLPTFPLPEGFSSNKEYLRHLTQNIGWFDRNYDKRTLEEQKIRQERLDYELEVIDEMGFSGYFLIVWDYINFCKDNDYPVGAGRGSAGGSIVCYLLGISALDPIDYNLIFERFLNKERISMPDIDLDFAYRDKVVEYLMKKYGEMRVCQVLNFANITPVVAIKDVGRILKDNNGKLLISSSIVNSISKLFTEKDFDKCLEVNGETISKYKGEVYSELFEIARMLSGRVRHVSTHAGGVGIVDTSMYDYMPMKLGEKGEHVIQVDKVMVEEIGIIKFDILGLNTLTIIDGVKKRVGLSDWDLDPSNSTFLNDEKMYELLRSGKTNNVFQVESQGMKDLLIRLQPNSLEDISAVLALYRPDSMTYLEDYIYYKHNKDEIKYIHNDMIHILETTNGQMIYQEQLMDIVRQFGGRTYGGADKFRKGIGKKNIELVQAEADKLYKEIKNNKYSDELAKTIADDLRTKGGYMFNKSHSALYAVITLQTAYLKAHYPVEFYCEVFNACEGDNGKLNKYMVEAQELNIEVLPPHINKSDYKFDVVDGNILFGLNSINKVGETVVDSIIKERYTNGKFNGLDDFLNRVQCNVAQMVMLIKSGALPTKDKYNMLLRYANKRTAIETEYKPYKDVSSLPTKLELKTKWGIDTDIIVTKEERLRLYNQKRKIEHDTVKYQEWLTKQEENKKSAIDDFKEKYMQNEQFWEFEALSIFLSNNPFSDIVQYNNENFYECESGDECVIIGIISRIQKKKDRNKKDYAFVNVYESNGLLEGIAWSSVYSKFIDLIKKNNKLAFYSEKSSEDTFIIKKIKTIDEWIKDRNLESIIKLN
jgi:DNA polymerase-3 subunit alpha